MPVLGGERCVPPLTVRLSCGTAHGRRDGPEAARSAGGIVNRIEPCAGAALSTGQVSTDFPTL